MGLPLADLAAGAQPQVFWLCAVLAAVVGLLLAFLDSSSPKDAGGNSPCSHLGACADSADTLFASLSADGAGLGLLEPLWRLLTPDGALFTLVTLGVSGLATSAGSVCAAGARLLRSAGSGGRRAESAGAEASPSGDIGQPPHGPEKLKMSLFVELHAYWAYFRLFAVGVLREYIVRSYALLGDEMACHYVNRERWNNGWVEFYKQHMYKFFVDCFNRPIASAPDACFDVVERTRPSGIIFGPLHEFQCTDKVRTCVNLGSYNYLGFGGVDKFCVPAARAAVVSAGFSAGGPRTEGGTRQVHRDLEGEVARFLGKEDALVLGMGFATNSTVLPALFEARAGGSGILVLSDELNHRSIVEGVRLSGATVRAFGHNSMPALEAALRRAVSEGQPAGKPWRKVFIVVEGIYSMEGDFCRLREIVTLKNRYKAYLYLDEAHSIGAVGPTGRGVSELLGVPTSEIDVMMGTFTKSFGSAGGYVAASSDVINALRRNAPGSVFAAAMPPPCAAQALAAFRVITGAAGGTIGAEKLASIRDNANYFRKRLEEEGFKVLGDVDSPIVPLMLHHPTKLARFSRVLLERGIAVVAVGYPAVPVLYERVRFCLSAAHTREQLKRVVDEIIEVGGSLNVLYEKGTEQAVVNARAVRAAEYAAWLRNAPVETAATAKVMSGPWSPEPLVPAVPLQSALLDAALEAATEAEPVAKLDLRLHDPLGYMRRPLEAAQKAATATMAVYGFGACGPRGFYGSTLPHIELEATLAKFLGTEAAIAYSAGVATASSVLPALLQPGDRVVVDSAVHLGIRTGLRLCKAQVAWVPHGDFAAMEAAVAKCATDDAKKEAAGRQQRTFIVAEALNQRTGCLAPLEKLVSLKETYGAFLILDESLSLGIFGDQGRGLVEHCNVSITQVDAIIGSLEYALAGVGGFCAGRKGLIDHQRLAGAGYCFSAACPPAACSAACATVADLASGGAAERMKSLRGNAAELHEALRAVASEQAARVELVSSPESYVQHLRLRSPGPCGGGEELLALAEACRRTAGLRVQVVSPGLCSAEGAFGGRLGAPPAPPPSLRLCISAEHTAEDIAAAAGALRSALQEAA